MNAETNHPFEATAVGAPTGLVGTITVEIYDPTNGDSIVAPTTAGITEPRPGTYVVELTCPSAGTYAVRWSADGITAEETLDVADFPVADPDEIMPTPDDVAALLRARTKDANGVELGAFTSATRPNDDEVEALVLTAYGDVTSQTGTHLSSRAIVAARSMVALRAAMLVELSYFPEQVRSDRSAYEHYARLYDDGMKSLLGVVADNAGDGGGIGGVPRYGALPVMGWTSESGPFVAGNAADYPFTVDP